MYIELEEIPDLYKEGIPLALHFKLAKYKVISWSIGVRTPTTLGIVYLPKTTDIKALMEILNADL